MDTTRSQRSRSSRCLIGLCLALPLSMIFGAASLAQGTDPTPPTLTYSLADSGTVPVKFNSVGHADYYDYDFNITGFSNVASDPVTVYPNGFYTIFSFSNSSIENSANVYSITPYNKPIGWSYSDTADFFFYTNTPSLGIHATDPTFGLTILQAPGTAPVSPFDAPFYVYHDSGATDPFRNTDGSPLVIYAQPAAAPEPSTLVPFGFAALGVLGLTVRARRRSKSLS